MIFFTGDTHFGHGNVIRFCNRPFATVQEMNKALINNWNKVVKPEDTVYHLGDFANKINAYECQGIRAQLNGNIFLITGNHEKAAIEMERKFGAFERVSDYLEIVVEGQKIMLFHYAMRVWHHSFRGSWHVFGHSHGRTPAYGKSVDVGVDVWDYTPVSFAQLKTFMDKQPMADGETIKPYTGNLIL